MAGGDQSSEPILRVMHALGSSRNRADFTLLLSRLNNVKSRVWRANVPPTSGETIESFIAIDNPRRALVMLREPLIVLAYLNHPVINTHIMNTANLVREEWGRADDAWEATGQPMEYVQD
ncbi:CAZyme family GH18 [Penicillium desertorum]|uniref:CAZyme family GH18 n=1 Tax=Penicillium desertorum TaxID=1303715 RepID=A0A9W9X474_9EURO|nr:CAZyme family GH18 [Penicillium desertorum]